MKLYLLLLVQLQSVLGTACGGTASGCGWSPWNIPARPGDRPSVLQRLRTGCIFLAIIHFPPYLHSSSLRRTASIVGDRSNVLDHRNLKAGLLERADCSLTACARAFHENLHRLHAVIHRDSSQRSPQRSCAANGVDFLEPRKPSSPELAHENGVALRICDGDDRIIKGGLDMAAPRSMFLRSRRLRDAAAAFLPPFCACAILNIPPDYFFLLAMVFLGPLRVRAFVLERWPLTGRPLR